MTRTRWFIVTFWIVMSLIGGWYVMQSILAPPPPVVPEKHWFPPPLPGAPPPSANADVRLTHYTITRSPNSSTFDANVTVQNFGQKKATAIQVKIEPYIGTTDMNNSQAGPDEIPTEAGANALSNIYQWVTFPDLDAGATATQTITLPMRSDADPADWQHHAQVDFQTAP